jgi:hypothetical protein
MVWAMSTSPTSCSFLLVEGLLWSRHRLSFPLISRLRLYGIDGPEADDIFASFELYDENKKKYAKVKEKFDNHFIVRRM